jgi:hypothetical protein
MDFKEIGWQDVEWVQLAQDRDQWRILVDTVMNLRVPLKPEKLSVAKMLLTSQ